MSQPPRCPLVLQSSRHMSCASLSLLVMFFFFNDPATTEIYTLSLHDALPIFHVPKLWVWHCKSPTFSATSSRIVARSEEHTSELQSPVHLVCRLLLEKKKKKTTAKREASVTRDATTTITHTVH